jgi:hypothetical protein
MQPWAIGLDREKRVTGRVPAQVEAVTRMANPTADLSHQKFAF